MPDFWPILYSAYIYLACKNTRFFPPLQTFLAKILLPPAFFSFSAEGACRLSCRRSADVKERMPFRGRAIYKKRRLSVKYTQ